MTSCRSARELFTRDLDGRVAADERDLLRTHLAQCTACRAERERWGSLSRALRAAGPTAVPVGLAARSLRAATRASAAPSPSLASWFVTAARPAALAGALAALVMSLLAAGGPQREHPVEAGLQDPMELAMQIWTGEVAVDGP